MKVLGPKSSTSRGYGQPAQLVGEPIDQLPLSSRGPVEGCPKSFLSPNSLFFPVEVRSRDAQNLLSLPVAFSSRSRFISSRSRSCWGNSNLSSIKCSNGQWIGQPLARPVEVTFCCFWLPSLETYKLIAPLHLLIREHLQSIVYLPVLDQKALIYFLVH